MRIARIVVLAAAIAAVLAACSGEPTHNDMTPAAPSFAVDTAAPDEGMFYPLAVGNHWSYDWSFSTQVIPDDGPPEPPNVVTGTIDVDQVETRTIGEYDYILEREVYSTDPGANERLRRQDRVGLYILDRSKDDGKSPHGPMLSASMQRRAERIAARTGASPASVSAHFARVAAIRNGLDAALAPPGGVHSGEIQTLAYPLRPGATWVIRGAPLFSATVEAFEAFDGFPAWRVRIDNEFLGSADAVHVWYGRCGEIGRRIHVESPFTSMDGSVLGTLFSDEYADLTDARIDRGGCAAGRNIGGGTTGGGMVRSVPLALGNRWTYRIRGTLHADPPVTSTRVVDDVQEQWVGVGGHTYLRQVMRPHYSSPWTAIRYSRQDGDGLYQLEPPMVPVSSPRGAPSALGLLTAMTSGGKFLAGPDAGESLALVYPLRVGESWMIRDDPAFGLWTATVEAREHLSLPAGDFNAFRVRIHISLQGPEDEAFIWYAPQGLVKLFQRTATVYGLMDEEWVLEELDLVN